MTADIKDEWSDVDEVEAEGKCVWTNDQLEGDAS